MISSENINELSAALAKAQGEFSVAKKDKKGVHGSTYADLDAVYEATRKPLSSNGLSVVQFPSFDGQFVCLTTRLMHSSGQYVQDELRLKPEGTQVHKVGSCITYARRYAYSAILGVVADEDDDGNSAMQRDAIPNKPHRIEPPALKPSDIYNGSNPHKSFLAQKVKPLDLELHELQEVSRVAIENKVTLKDLAEFVVTHIKR